MYIHVFGIPHANLKQYTAAQSPAVSPVQSMSLLYQLDETVERLLRLETFQTDDFSEREFIQKLSADLGSSLDPKPYIRQFEQALKELQSLQDQTRIDQASFSKKARDLEYEHAENVYDIGDTVDATVADFNRLEERIADVTSATSGLSEKLKALSSQYDRTSEAAFLVKCYLSFVNSGQCPELVALWETAAAGSGAGNSGAGGGGIDGGVGGNGGGGGGGDGAPTGLDFTLFAESSRDRKLCARVVSQLQALSSKIGSNHSSHEQIDRFAEQLEQDLLNKFDHAYAGFDLKAMRDASDMLCDFNGGASVVQMFVSQHEFFLETDKFVDSKLVTNSDIWLKMSAPDGDTIEFEDALQQYMDEIIQVTMGQMDVILKVFRDPVIVVRVFVQRMFAQRIQQLLEDIFAFAEKQSNLAYVRALHISYNKIGMLVKRFKELFSGDSSSDSLDPNGDIGLLLDQSFGDIFLPYIDNGRYFEAEKRNLHDVISTSLSRFTEGYTQKRLARDQGILGRLTSSLEKTSSSDAVRDSPRARTTTNGGNHTNGSGGSTPNLSNNNGHDSTNQQQQPHVSGDDANKGRLGQIMRAVRREKSNSDKGDDRDAFEEEDLELRYDLLQRILSAFAEAVSRDLELNNPTVSKQNAVDILKLLVDLVGTKYIGVALDDALHSSSEDQKSQTIYLGYLRTVGTATGCIKLLSLFSQTAMFSMVQGSDRIHAQMAAILNSYVKSVESKANSILQNTAELLREKIAQYLNKQKKKDFLPKDDRNSDTHTASPNASSSTMNSASGTATNGKRLSASQESVTPVCKDVCALLDGFYAIAQDSLDGDNLEQFLLAVGLSLRSLLAAHLKKFNISRAGGRILARDLQLYQETIDKWSLRQLSEGFTILHEIGSLFTADPQAIPSLVRDSHLSQLKSVQIKDYVSKRVDYYSNSLNNVIRSEHSTQLPPYLGAYSLYSR